MNVEDLTISLGSGRFKVGELTRQQSLPFTVVEQTVVDLIRKWIKGEKEFMVSTSGSTGAATNVTFRREQMQASAMLTGHALSLTEGMTALLCLDPQFIAGKMMVIRSLVIGMDLIVLNPVANPLGHIPGDVPSIDFTAMVPLQVLTALDSARASSISRLTKVIIGGGPVDSTLRERLQNLSSAFYATFGMTETISHVALQRLNGDTQTDFMTALPGIRFSTDPRGCLVIESPYTATPLTTNDVVELVDNQKFKWLGRWDNVINTGGIKVNPELLEAQVGVIIQAMHTRNNFFIHGSPHPSLGSAIVLVMEGMVEPESEQRILLELKQKLPRYTAPRQIMYVDKFVYTATGKIKRDATVEKASPRPGS